MDTNKRKTGLARLIEIAGTKRRLLIGAMLLAVITAIMQFVPIIAVYNILIELAEHALDPSLIDKAYIWQWGYIALGAFFAFGVLTFASLMLSHIAVLGHQGGHGNRFGHITAITGNLQAYGLAFGLVKKVFQIIFIVPIPINRSE